MRRLTRIKQIQALEAAARYGSFAGAANELGITPAAAGQLVRSLESWIGYPLFRRTHGGRQRLEPVEETRLALEDLSAGFDRLETGLAVLKSRKSRRTVTVTASQAFVANWLMIRLNDFTGRYPRTDVRLDVSDRLVDLAHQEADIGIRFGLGIWEELKVSRLMNEEIIAVCRPDLLPSGGIAGTDWFRNAPLIHNIRHYAHHDIPDWNEWLQKFDLVHDAETLQLQINATAAVIQAALSGRGVALVRRALVLEHIASGRLRHLWPQLRFPIRHAYYVVTSRLSLQRPEVTEFHDWLLAQTATQMK